MHSLPFLFLAVAFIPTPDIVDKATPSVVQVGNMERPFCSGFLIDNNHIVTCHHCTEGENVLIVKTNDGIMHSAIVIAKSQKDDLAILKISPADGKVYPGLRLRKKPARVGETVIAIGHGKGLVNTVTKGIISGVNRDIPFGDVVLKGLIQTDCPANPGSSGCVLLDEDAEVLGVINGGFLSSQSIIFAIPASKVAHLAGLR